MRPRPKRRRAVLLAAVVAALLGAACGPPDPPPVGWETTSRLHVGAPNPIERPLTATNSQWWAVVDMAPSVPGDATLHLFARTGADGAPEPTPSQSIPLGAGIAGLAMSDHVLAVDHHNALANLRTVDLYELDTATGTWSLGSTVPRGYDPTRLIDLDVTDTQLVIGDSSAPGGSVDGTVVVVPISLAGPGITWSFGSVTALGPDPSWTSTDRLGFGRRVAVEGDALAVSGGADHVRFYTQRAKQTQKP